MEAGSVNPYVRSFQSITKQTRYIVHIHIIVAGTGSIKKVKVILIELKVDASHHLVPFKPKET